MGGQGHAMIGDYQLGNCIGKGGYGAVYQAVNIQSADFVAIKQVKLSAIPKDQLSAVMMEIDLLKKLKHENIVKYVGYTKTKEYLNIILEYVENGSLTSILQKFGSFPESLVRVFMRQTLEGLKYLHEQGVIHRDIKGANILSTKQGTVKLADFGVATKIGKADQKKDAEVAGTPYWMAPEIIELAGASPSSDIWSVGCTVIELITGAPPYFDLQPMPALFRIVQDDHPPLPDNISAQLRDFLMQCFQKEPALRISAQKLLKHRWLKDTSEPSKAVKSTVTHVPNFEEVEKNIKEYNEKLNEDKRQSVLFRTITTISGLSNALREANISSKKDDKKKKPSHAPAKAEPKVQAKPTKASSSAIPTPAKDEDEDWDALFDSVSDTKESPKLSSSPSSPSTKKSERTLKKSRGGEKKKKPSQSTLLKQEAAENDENWDEAFGSEFDDIVFPGESKDAPKSEKTLSKSTSSKKSTDRKTQRTKRDKKTTKEKKIKKESTKKKENKSDTLFNEAIEIESKEESDSDWGDVLDIDRQEENGEGSNEFAQLLQAKLKPNAVGEQDADDDDDAFGDDFDDDGDNRNILFDNYQKLSNEILKSFDLLKKANLPDQDHEQICAELIQSFQENPDIISRLMRHNGVIPIIEILEAANTSVLHRVLRLVNQITEGNKEIQENLCMVGGIPAIMKFTTKQYPLAVRTEAAKFVKQMCVTSSFTLQMFIACRGIPTLVSLLEVSNYNQEKYVLDMAIDGITSVFDLHSTPKNDFCRMFVKCDALSRLARALLLTIADDADKSATTYAAKVADIFQCFSTGDKVVKAHFADSKPSGVLDLIFLAIDRLKEKSSIDLLGKIVKTIKQLSSDSSTLDPLQKANAIPKLVSLLDTAANSEKKELSNQLLGALYNLTRISNDRQEQAAKAGIIPHLKNFIDNNSPLKQFALSIICDLGHVEEARKTLWSNACVSYYIKLLKEEYWRANAVDALAVWMQDEAMKVSEICARKENVTNLAQAFSTSTGQTFINIVDPFLRLLSASPTLTKYIGNTGEFLPKLIEQLKNTKQQALVRVTLIKMLSVTYAHCEKPEEKRKMVDKYGLKNVLLALASDNSVLIQELASQLLTAIETGSSVLPGVVTKFSYDSLKK